MYLISFLNKFIMKALSILTFMLIFVGCSSTYRITDFPSREKFYEDYNSFAKGKNIKITLVKDSSFYSPNSSEIVDDTLFYLKDSVIIKNYVLPTNEVKKIDYLSSDFKSAKFTLISGEQLTAKNIFSSKDTVRFIGTKKLKSKYPLVPIDKVKFLSYRIHWPGLVTGLIITFPLSFLIAALGESGDTSNSGFFGSGAAIYLGVPVVTILGGVLGWLDGGYSFYYYMR